MRFALAQLNPIVGDLKYNAEKILSACKAAYQQNANIVLTSELSLWGYPPKDLLLNPYALNYQKIILDEIAESLFSEAPNLSLLIGIIDQSNDLQVPSLFNSVAIVKEGGWEVIARKQLLPTYDIFDEARYFRSGKDNGIITLQTAGKALRVGITICEDLWVEGDIQTERTLGDDPIAKLTSERIDLLVNISASPFSVSKESIRQRVAKKASIRLNCPIVYLNQVGGNDELVFDGSSFILNNKGELILSLPSCEEALTIWDSNSTKTTCISSASSSYEKIFKSLVLGVKDYASKCGFKSATLGLSGGIDSALVTTIAVAALGKANINPILMPSPWSSTGSINDSVGLANRLGISTKTIPIESLMQSFDYALTEVLGGKPQGVTAENLQSRIRGALLMAIANTENHLLLSTGNKSELAVGYCTLYGDMNGGLSVIGDLFKTNVFELCKWIDSEESFSCREKMGLISNGEIIGTSILQKPPSAELQPDQLDSDSLPAYPTLDRILKAIIDDNIPIQALIEKGEDPILINRISLLIKNAEFKRRQAPPLLKVSKQAFGSGWRRPIATT